MSCSTSCYDLCPHTLQKGKHLLLNQLILVMSSYSPEGKTSPARLVATSHSLILSRRVNMSCSTSCYQLFPHPLQKGKHLLLDQLLLVMSSYSPEEKTCPARLVGTSYVLILSSRVNISCSTNCYQLCPHTLQKGKHLLLDQLILAMSSYSPDG